MGALRPVAAALRRLTHRVGRRGCSLLFFAFLDFVYGASLAFPPAETRDLALYKYMTTIIPLQAWGAIWLAVGVACLVDAFRVDDRIGFAAATALKVAWGLVSASAWVLADVPRGYVSAAIWLCLAGWVMVISTWPEAPAIRERRGR